MGGVGQMLTFAYKVGGWGQQNAYVIIRISWKRPNWPQRKAARFCNFWVLDQYKFYDWWQIIQLELEKNNSESQFSPSNKIWVERLSFIWWFLPIFHQFLLQIKIFLVRHKLLLEQFWLKGLFHSGSLSYHGHSQSEEN